VRRLLQRELNGLSLHTAVVKASDYKLYIGAIRHFRNLGNALRAAGIDPESVSGMRVWTKQRVVHRIRELERQGVAMNAKALRKVDGGLVQVTRRYWGSWDDALNAAGLDAAVIRHQPRPWTKSSIVQAIRNQAASGARVSKYSIRPRSIGKAACRLFGSFEAAVRVAGVDQQRNSPPPWSRARVEAAIRRRLEAGEPLNCMAVIRTDTPLYGAAQRYHGGWHQALTAAGIDPDSVRASHQQWTRESVMQELRRRVAEGVPPTYVSLIRPGSLVKVCKKLFGSWEAAALAAGVDPAKLICSRSRRNRLRRPGSQE